MYKVNGGGEDNIFFQYNYNMRRYVFLMKKGFGVMRYNRYDRL